ncbi:hypothetical protein II1_05679 [Bacillus cereus MC118]|uniref:Uncharacterized protein n=1 Tax=Bacillus cereus MC67 TaxID=1053219 RepID=J8BJJ2_BACCE|nr:hypothetical protein II3_05038 [Bacillus cereus MC67]EOO97411.1 hypothetical protein II1_05679 [Bacillus cereus MC118]
MKVMCIKNSGDKFSEVVLNQGYNRDSIINLETDKEYVVYGISSLNGALDYLILGENENLPSWYPAELFEVSNPLQPLEGVAPHIHQLKVYFYTKYGLFT